MRLNRWMDNQGMCKQLNISPRTLQDYRNNGMIAYYQVRRKDSLQGIGHQKDACDKLSQSVLACRHIMPNIL